MLDEKPSAGGCVAEAVVIFSSSCVCTRVLINKLHVPPVLCAADVAVGGHQFTIRSLVHVCTPFVLLLLFFHVLCGCIFSICVCNLWLSVAMCACVTSAISSCISTGTTFAKHC